MYSSIERLPDESYNDWKRRAYEETSDQEYVCNECGLTKLGSAFVKSIGSADGRTNQCRACSAEYRKRWKGEKLESRRAEYESTLSDLFTCRTCGESKLGSDFPFNVGSRGGRSLSRCRKCNAASMKSSRDGGESLTVMIEPLEKPPHFDARKAFFEAKEHHAKRAHVAHMVRDAVRSGRLTKPDACELCGKNHGTQIEGHHFKALDDLLYEDILQVVFLCQPCHLKAHDGNFKNPPLHPFALAQSVIETIA